MSDEKSQQQTSTESTVAGAAKAGKAISNIAKGAAAGGAHGAAIEAGKSSAKWLIPLIAAVLLPLILVAMLPSIIFGSLLGDGTDSPNGISNDEVLVQNMTAINEGISSILSEGLTDVLERIDSDFASSGCDGKEINNPFGADVVFNANAFVSQYCAHKDTEIASISKKDIVKVFNLVEMDHSDSWNCLGEVGSSELMAQTFADIVLQNTSGDSKDAFWYNAELNLLKALVLYVALEMPPEKRNIATVYDLLYTQTEKGLSDMMASISHEHANQYTGELLPPSPASAPYAIFRQSSETVRTSVIIGLGSKLAVLQAQQVRNITSYNEIDLELPGKQKCAYFCIVSDQDSTYDFLSSLFFSFLFIRLIRYADAYCEGGMLHPKVKFILDEFPNCCLIPDFTKKCSTIRSRGCSVAVFFQNVGQMRNRYPDDQWQEILGACDSTVFLGCTDMLTAEYFSDRIGTASVEVEGTMRELNTMHITDYTPRFRKTNSLGRRPLLTPDEVLRLPPDQVLIFIRGQKVMRAKRFDYSLHPDYKKLKSRKAILHEPDWKSSQASSVSASGVSSPSVTAAIPAEKANVGSQKKPPGKPPRSTTRKVVNADELF